MCQQNSHLTPLEQLEHLGLSDSSVLLRKMTFAACCTVEHGGGLSRSAPRCLLLSMHQVALRSGRDGVEATNTSKKKSEPGDRL